MSNSLVALESLSFELSLHRTNYDFIGRWVFLYGFSFPIPTAEMCVRYGLNSRHSEEYCYFSCAFFHSHQLGILLFPLHALFQANMHLQNKSYKSLCSLLLWALEPLFCFHSHFFGGRGGALCFAKTIYALFYRRIRCS